MIEIKNLVKKFHSGEIEISVLQDITFAVPDGQFLAITGRSGAGKSTLLYQISLLDVPTSGEIMIDGQNIAALSGNERVLYRRDNFGFIFQDYALLPTLTAVENVMLPLLMQGTEKTEAMEKAKGALDRVELSDKYTNLPSQLSGGQQQRVSIARSIVHNPKILFADEPTANLDTFSSKTVLDIFLKLNKESKLTIVMVTHEAEYAQLAHRTLDLLDGKIVADKIKKKK
jgi:putative ABC transport system ATP-binding protein